MKKLMESTVFKILQIIVATALLVFGAFAPVSEKAALFALWLHWPYLQSAWFMIL